MRLADDVVVPFVKHLGSHPSFSKFWMAPNSFEGWLKWELVAFSTNMILQHAEMDTEYVGVETRQPLLGKADCPSQDKTHKLVDFWILDEATKASHYLEIKVVFGNRNQGKQARSAGWDLWYLASLVPEAEAGSLGLLLFVRKEDPDKTIEEVMDRVSEQVQEAMAPIKATEGREVENADYGWLIYQVHWETAFKMIRQVS